MKTSLILFAFALSMAMAYSRFELSDKMSEKAQSMAVINSIVESLLAEQQRQDPCNGRSECACLQAIDLWVKTSTITNAQTGGTHQLEIKYSDGESNKFVLSGIPAQGQSKLFTFSLDDSSSVSMCASIYDIESIVINAVSTDGWNINSAVTVLADSSNRTFTGSIDRGIDAWVDHQDLPQYEQLILSLTGHN